MQDVDDEEGELLDEDDDEEQEGEDEDANVGSPAGEQVPGRQVGCMCPCFRGVRYCSGFSGERVKYLVGA
jgi:hypothetical protein